MAKLEFWFDFASSYAYLAAMRITGLAAATRVEIAYRPFLLGPIFKAQGLTTSPFVLNPAKGRYMARDIARTAAARGIAFHLPEPFPAHSLASARVAMIAEAEGWIGAFTQAVFMAEFAKRADIAAPETLARIVAELGRDPARIMARAGSDEVKCALRSRTQAAVEKGIFGAPTFITGDGELFWGDDRLEAALAWASAPGERVAE
ncbi:MAG: 2-hydroxychromene-2-carboxylate isomerase [Hyphomicrobiaceae bacterium]